MPAPEFDRIEAVIEEPPHSVRLASVGRRLGVAFQKRGLSGVWAIKPVTWPSCIDGLQILYETLKGQVVLTDDESTSLTFTVSPVGRILVDLWIDLWSTFSVEGELRLQFSFEQTALAAFIRSLRQISLEMSAASEEITS